MEPTNPSSNDTTANLAFYLNRLVQEAKSQSWPTGCLYVVATPIGNRADISARALVALELVDVIAAEDTRCSRTLLNSYGINSKLIAAHQHNEREVSYEIIQRLQDGQRVALISDAGTPAVSDPGAKIVQLVRQAGLEVRAIAGPSAVMHALMLSGVTSDENPAFAFAGFIPAKSGLRQRWLEQWGQMAMPVVMFESPHRLASCLADMLSIYGAQRILTIGREFSKRFEQCVQLPLGEVSTWLNEDNHHSQGEFVLILAQPAQSDEDNGALDANTQKWLEQLAPLMSVRDCVKVLQNMTSFPKSQLYDAVLEFKAKAEE